MFQMLGVFSEFVRAIIVERVNSGLDRARAAGARLGRPKISSEVEARIEELRIAGMGIKAVARKLGVGTGTVQRVDLERRQRNMPVPPLRRSTLAIA